MGKYDYLAIIVTISFPNTKLYSAIFPSAVSPFKNQYCKKQYWGMRLQSDLVILAQ